VFRIGDSVATWTTKERGGGMAVLISDFVWERRKWGGGGASDQDLPFDVAA
jgi:hypothetical protein